MGQGSAGLWTYLETGRSESSGFRLSDTRLAMARSYGGRRINAKAIMLSCEDLTAAKVSAIW